MTLEPRARLKRKVIILAFVLLIGGLFVLVALERMPLPLRLVVGLGDVFTGLILLVLARQKFSNTERP